MRNANSIEIGRVGGFWGFRSETRFLNREVEDDCQWFGQIF